jgi:hypothetical protein
MSHNSPLATTNCLLNLLSTMKINKITGIYQNASFPVNSRLNASIKK